jgi:arylsulfatase A-like enzyme
MPHIPLYVPEDVRDPNPLNAYINVIEHIDEEVGRLLNTLDELKLAENTFVIYTTDNGPWLQFQHHGGSAGPLRAGKGTTFEGGQRVPCLMRGPGIPAGTVTNELTGTIDVLPTIAALTGKPLPAENKIDGMDVSDLWLSKTDRSPRDEFIHYTSQGNLQGIRKGNWKLLVIKPRQRRNQKKAAAEKSKPQIMLFDLSQDLGEQNNLADERPDVVRRLQQRMKNLDDEITLNARTPWMKNKQ